MLTLLGPIPLKMSNIEHCHMCIDDCNSSDCSSSSDYTYDPEAEAGLMDYRGEEVLVEVCEGKIIIKLTFAFCDHSHNPVPVPHDFDARWCSKFSAATIADELGVVDIYPNMYIQAARWLEDHVTLEITAAYEGEPPAIEELLMDLETNSLEDGPFEGFPGDNFWVPSQRELKDML